MPGATRNKRRLGDVMRGAARNGRMLGEVMRGAARDSSSTIIGVDFGAPRSARDQRRKIVAIAARPMGGRRYRIDDTGMNERLLARDPPGWSAAELLEELLGNPVRVVGFDFPFGIPEVLLCDERFAAGAGYQGGAFLGWRTFHAFVAERLRLEDPLDFRPFDAWRARAERARRWTWRATDVAAGAQPPLKDRFQATFQMTLLENVLLARLWESRRYRVLPFPGGRGAGEIIEVYPRATLRRMGMASYKARPAEAIRLGVAACAAAGIRLDVDLRLMAFCCRYSSGGAAPDYDAADAFVALCTAILHAEGACRAAIGGDSHQKELEGAIWVPSIEHGAPA
jgi:hypothetical protein